MTQSITLTILSPDQVILNVKKVRMVRTRLRGDSWLSIYPNHAPLIAELLPGKLVYSADDQQEEIDLPAGIMQVNENKIKIFTGSSLHSETSDEVSKVQQFDNLSRMLMQSLDTAKTEENHYQVEE
jgi:F0F1-type ATP synthase epsilon subunit